MLMSLLVLELLLQLVGFGSRLGAAKPCSIMVQDQARTCRG